VLLDGSFLPEATTGQPGKIWVGTELIFYGFRADNTLSLLTRGALGTTIQDHPAGTPVYSSEGTELFNDLNPRGNIWLDQGIVYDRPTRWDQAVVFAGPDGEFGTADDIYDPEITWDYLERSNITLTSETGTISNVDGLTLTVELDDVLGVEANVGVKVVNLDTAELLTLAENTEINSVSVNGKKHIREFEPIINVPAAAAFLLIAVVFTLLQIRINAVSDASKRRSRALEALRRVESLQLSGSDDSLKRPNEVDVSSARQEYESALREELDLRKIIPGVRIVAPNDPKRDAEQRAAAKRFLGWDGNEFDDEDEITDSGGLQQGSKEEKELTGGAKFVLFGVASTLILLLWTLSFDPMSTSVGSFTTLLHLLLT
jgi:hypothetical protein